MKYIIADPDIQNAIELKKILDEYEILEFMESFVTFFAAVNYSLKHQPDILFIFLGKAELNAIRLVDLVRECNPFSKVIFISGQKENAVEAFEYEVDGFILVPFNKEKIGQLLKQIIG